MKIQKHTEQRQLRLLQAARKRLGQEWHQLQTMSYEGIYEVTLRTHRQTMTLSLTQEQASELVGELSEGLARQQAQYQRSMHHHQEQITAERELAAQVKQVDQHPEMRELRTKLLRDLRNLPAE